MKPSLSLTIVAILLMFVGAFPGSSVEMDDLVFYFSLDEGQGDKIKDLSPNKLLGKVEKNPKWIDGKVEGGLHFTLGKYQGVLVEHNDILNLGTEDVSLEAWFKTAKKSGQGFMYIKWSGPGYYTKLRDGMLYTRYHNGAAGGEISSKTSIADDKWHHVVSVRSDKTKIQIYLDGKLEIEAQAKSESLLEFLFAGGRNDNQSNWEGRLDEAAVFDRALTPAEIKKLSP